MKPHDPANRQTRAGPGAGAGTGAGAEQRPQVGPRIAHRTPCAVVVERDPEVAHTLARWLAPELEVQLADSAVRASAVLKQLPFVDLAFLDLELPAHVGEELLQQLGHWPDAIRVLLSERAPAPGRKHPEIGPPESKPLELPRNRHLAHLVLIKPVGPAIVQALKRATLGLPRS